MSGSTSKIPKTELKVVLPPFYLSPKYSKFHMKTFTKVVFPNISYNFCIQSFFLRSSNFERYGLANPDAPGCPWARPRVFRSAPRMLPALCGRFAALSAPSITLDLCPTTACTPLTWPSGHSSSASPPARTPPSVTTRDTPNAIMAATLFLCPSVRWLSHALRACQRVKNARSCPHHGLSPSSSGAVATTPSMALRWVLLPCAHAHSSTCSLMMANSPPTRSQPHPFRSELALKAPPSSSSSQSRADRHHCRAGARLHVEAHLRPSSGQASRRNEFHSTHSTFPSRSPTSSVVTSPESGRHRRASPLLRRRTTPVDLRPRILRQTGSWWAPHHSHALIPAIPGLPTPDFGRRRPSPDQGHDCIFPILSKGLIASF